MTRNGRSWLKLQSCARFLSLLRQLCFFFLSLFAPADRIPLEPAAVASDTTSKMASQGAQPRMEEVQENRIEGAQGNQDGSKAQTSELEDGSRGILHGDASIEPGGSDEDGEFSASDFDGDSVLDDRSDSTSLRSSILEHSYINGRRYHRYRHGRYPIPNDEAEQNREDMLHTMMMESTDGRLFYAPVGQYPQKVIDLGTGTGLWAIECKRMAPNYERRLTCAVGDRYPSAEIMGLDLSPIQPAWVPPNVKYESGAI